MTTIEIFKKARIDSVSKSNRSMTATGIDTITGRIHKRTFHYIPDRVLDKAEQYVGRIDSSLIIHVDSGTKSIDLHEEMIPKMNEESEPVSAF